MAFPQGIDFRSTAGYVTDPADCTSEVVASTSYQRTTPQGNTVGWEIATGLSGKRDRSLSNDPRLAGVTYTTTTGTATYRVDLPAPGQYELRLACGDAGSASYALIEAFDDTTSLGVVVSQASIPSNSFADATNTVHTAANWPANNSPVTLTFASTIFRLKMGPSTVASRIAHLYLSAVSSGGDIALTPTGIATAPSGLSNPALSQNHDLAGDTITASSALSAPDMVQSHALTASAIATASPTLGAPALSGDAYDLVGSSIGATPTLSSPALLQNHALTVGAIAAGPSSFGTPTIEQQHALLAMAVTTGAVTLSSPVLTDGGVALFTQEELDYLLAYMQNNLTFPPGGTVMLRRR